MIETFLQQSVYTITMAAVYGLFAAGFVLIFGVLDVLNLAYAFVFMFTANVAVWCMTQGWSIWLAIVTVIVIGMALGAATDLIAYRPLQRRKGFASAVNFGPLISTLAVGGILEAVAAFWFGARNQIVPTGAFPDATLDIGGVRITLLQAAVVVSGLTILLLLHHFLRSTVWGRALRAVAENRRMATLVGVNTHVVISGVWVLSSALAAIAGVFIALVTSGVSTTMGSTYELKGFIVVVLGGMGSVSGAIVAAVLLSVLETIGVVGLGGQYRDIIPLAAIVLILLVRPNGLFGSRARTV
jgi:branched-chain amino acid transport system permease protein